ncbi:MAG: AAA family ATPase, partial [Planctomycetaceae bacterium]|nr:AAA family ATPase [Planctomycetaceae bacterium]
ESRLHLIHGFNGTGKSTLVDAVELLLTNQVERITRSQPANSIRYDEILRNRDLSRSAQSTGTQESARVRTTVCTGVSQKSSTTVEMEVTTSGLERIGRANRTRRGAQQLDAFRSSVTARPGSFRLEQNLSDRLTLGSAAERAGIILDLYFPDSGEQRRRIDELRGATRAAVEELRKSWPGAESVDWLKPLMEGKINESGFRLLREKTKGLMAPLSVSAFLGLYAGNRADELLKAMSVLRGSQWADAPEAAKSRAAEVDSPVESQQAWRESQHASRIGRTLQNTVTSISATVSSLDRIQDVIQRLTHWRAEKGTAGGTMQEYSGLVSDWLSQCVQADLATRLHRLAKTIDDGGELSDEFRQDVDVVQKAVSEKQVQKRAALYQERRENLWKQLIGFSSAQQVAEASVDRPVVSSDELAVLDDWIVSEPPISVVIRESLQSDEPRSGVMGESATYVVGSGEPASLTPILRRIEEVSQAARTIAGMSIPHIPELYRTTVALRHLHEIGLNYEQLNRDALKELQGRLESNGRLTLAVNELLALFTPARWAYGDISTDPRFEDETPGLSLNAGNSEVAQILNTAELNALALTLFLLCAPQIPNPLNLLVLDDPLQNMDALTVTAVARGIDRLMLLWRQIGADVADEQGRDLPFAPLSELRVLILLHAMDDIHRFRTESVCAIYRLPWLTPDVAQLSDDAAPQEIPVEQSMPQKLQPPALRILPARR